MRAVVEGRPTMSPVAAGMPCRALGVKSTGCAAQAVGFVYGDGIAARQADPEMPCQGLSKKWIPNGVIGVSRMK